MRILLLLICLKFALPLYSAQTSDRRASNGKPGAPLAAEESAKATQFAPGPDDALIANRIAQVLQEYHYLRPKFDDSVSSKFLDRYLNDLDPQHIHFLQSDLAEFESYRNSLDDLTLERRDTTPADVIFSRFFERLQQRTAYAIELLKTETFTFTNDERVTLNRKDLPHPKDLAEAKQLWRDRLRYEYLQEKLNAPKPKQKGPAVFKSKDGTEEKTPAKVRTPEQIHADIVNTLTRRYTRNVKTFKEWDSDDVLQVYLNTLAHVFDPHSDYFGKSALENFAMSMNLSLFGIGAVLTTDDGYCKILELKPGPAMKSKKIKANDRIVAVAQGDGEFVDVVEMQLNKVVNLIRGPKDTKVRLTIIPADAPDPSARETVALIRDEIKLEDQEAKAKIIELPSGKSGPLRLGIIDLPSFYAPMELLAARGKSEPRFTSVDVAKLLKKLKEEKVGGVILDLRRNGGGSLEEAIKLTGLFIKRGPVVQVRDWNGDITLDEDKDPSVLYDGPLLVLTSRGSASASEILTGALQDYGRALLVGDSSTHGKGTVQMLNQLKPSLKSDLSSSNDPGALKVTIRKFYRPSGSSTQLKGVVPDIVLPSVNNVAEIGEASLENPLEWDEIDSAKFEHLNRVEPYLAELRKRSSQRIAADKDFSYVSEDIDLYKKAMADKSISLNEAERLKEKDEAEARQKARDQERLARHEPEQKTFDVTVKQADQPGLPPPTVKTNTALIVRGKNLNPSNRISAGVATNSASVGKTEIRSLNESDPERGEDEEKPPAVDVVLQEAEHILLDYLSLAPKEPVLSSQTLN